MILGLTYPCSMATYGSRWRFAMESCTYCRDTTEITRDHVVPMVSHANYRYYTNKRTTVPCCKHCNSMKMSKSFETFEDICNYLAMQLHKKVKKLTPNNPKYNTYMIRIANLKEQLRS